MQKLIILSFLVMACSQNSKKFRSEVEKGNCDYAAEIFPINKDNQDLINKTKQLTKTTASLAIELTATTLGLLISPLEKEASADAKTARLEARELRCPDLDEVTKHSIELVSCFKAKGDLANLKKAQSYLETLRNDKDYLKCIPRKQKIEIDNLHDEVNTLYRYRYRSKQIFQ